MTTDIKSYYGKLYNIYTNTLQILKKIKIEKNMVIIFDIDETILTNEGQLIIPTYLFYLEIKKMGITPIFVTARTNETVDYTHSQFNNYEIHSKNLSKYDDGYVVYNSNHTIYFRHRNDDNIEKYKENARRCVYEQGYNIIMSIGDQPWDVGEYGGTGIILPPRK